RRRHTRFSRDWSSDVCSSDLPLAQMALSFDAGNYFALMVMGLTLAIVLAGGSLIKAMCMLVTGVVLALVGADPLTAVPRLTLGLPVLYDGISIAIIAMGLFGIAEILRNLEMREARPQVKAVVGRLLPDWNDV